MKTCSVIVLDFSCFDKNHDLEATQMEIFISFYSLGCHEGNAEKEVKAGIKDEIKEE